MHSTFQRLNNITSLATTYLMVLLSLISIASYLALPPVNMGRIDVKDLIIQHGRLRRYAAKNEELASIRFDLTTDLTTLLTSYNTKQLFLYLTASYETDPSLDVPQVNHEVVLWDRIITRADTRDFRAVGNKMVGKTKGKKGRGKIRVEEGKNVYTWRDPSGSFKNIPSANLTLHYSLMPYVGLISSGIAATAQGPIALPEPLFFLPHKDMSDSEVENESLRDKKKKAGDLTIFHVKVTTSFDKVFKGFADKYGIRDGVYRFLYYSHRLGEKQTPSDFGMRPGHRYGISAEVLQEGG
ncbi:signal peptidase [Tremella mesenterica]|uniref:Signal peptidase complex subunit 3 n=1 Tax=Tremella mesenterica TaxID=5217 RepID=A0A4Q1BQU9_TREME|nr:signal peptidase [Tremella mesenterica]